MKAPENLIPAVQHSNRHEWGPLIGLWALWRGLSGIWVLVLSSLRPLTPVEQAHPAFWPPFEPLSLWLERVILAPWFRWDAVLYLQIVTEGYQPGSGLVQFHPLYPWAAQGLAQLKLSPALSLWLVSSICGLLFLLVFERLARLDCDRETARMASRLLFFFPVAFVLFAPYSEALFLLCAALCLWWARQRRWIAAGLAGGLAALTRQQGIFLGLPLLWEIGEAVAWDWRKLARDWRHWVGAGLIPGGLLFWIFYRWQVLGDVHPDFSSLNAFIYSLIISPGANQVVPLQEFTWPWRAVGLAWEKVRFDLDMDILLNLVLGGWFLLYLGLAWRRLRPSYRLYGAVVALVSFSYNTGSIHPYMGLPRHLLLAFPVFIGLSGALQRPWQRLLAVGLGFSGELVLLFSYVLHIWIP